jgi:hypothetical protein
MYLIEPFYSEEVSLGYWIQGVGNKLTGNFNRRLRRKAMRELEGPVDALTGV